MSVEDLMAAGLYSSAAATSSTCSLGLNNSLLHELQNIIGGNTPSVTQNAENDDAVRYQTSQTINMFISH